MWVLMTLSRFRCSWRDRPDREPSWQVPVDGHPVLACWRLVGESGWPEDGPIEASPVESEWPLESAAFATSLVPCPG
jgi:hypothetical protein